MGEIFPMAASEVVGVLPSVAGSFRFEHRQHRRRAPPGSPAGIMGVLGAADMIPVEVVLNGAGPAQTYRVNVVRHSYLSPLMLAMVTGPIVSINGAAGERRRCSNRRSSSRASIRCASAEASQDSRRARRSAVPRLSPAT
jgi:hypothetical protein